MRSTRIKALSTSTTRSMLATFEHHSMEAFLGLVHDNVGNAAELTALWRLLEQALSIIHSFGDATGQIASPKSFLYGRVSALPAHRAGIRISQLDRMEGRFYREALLHLRAVQEPGQRSKLEEKRLNDMERIVRIWNLIFGAAHRILRVHGRRDPLAPRLQILSGKQTSRIVGKAVVE